MSRPGLERRWIVKLIVALPLCASQAALVVRFAHAEEHEVNTRASQWAPAVLFIDPGDTIVFRGMSGHETELIDGMGPAGAAPWRSELDEEGFSITLEARGAYIYKCHVHMNAGMVGAIVVGDSRPRNLAAIEAAMSEIEAGRAFVERIVGRLERELERRSD